ncbi:hypothetical protein AABB24_024348, partial [Solanum stoloniferum]
FPNSGSIKIRELGIGFGLDDQRFKTTDMPRYESKNDDRRRSSPYSYEDRKSHYHQSQSNGSQHYRVKANGSGDQDHHRHRHREEYKDKSTRSYRRNDDNEDYSRSKNHKSDRSF